MTSTTTSPAAGDHLRGPSRVLLMGAPGSGKRTQGVALAQRLGVPSVSTGDLFRAIMTYDTRVAARVRDAVGHGGYVDDAITNDAVDERLVTDELRAGFLLYGYPRTAAQAQHLDRLLAEQQTAVDAVVCLRVDDDELVGRLHARGQELGRLDDRDETIRPRLALYREKTEPLVEEYRDRGLLVEVDGSGPVAQVGERIGAALQARTVAGPGTAS